MAKKNNKHKHQTGGLQEKKVRVEPTKEEIKQEQAEIKEKRKEKKKERKKDRVKITTKLKDLVSELKKVNWPTPGRAFKQTGVVLGVVIVFSLVLFGINMGLTALFDLLTGQLEMEG